MAYQGEGDVTEYREGVFVGYRYYATKKMPVLFPFGYGLSYTTFAISNLRTEQDEYQSHDVMTVSVDVTNTGDRAGKEVVQLYVLPKTKPTRYSVRCRNCVALKRWNSSRARPKPSPLPCTVPAPLRTTALRKSAGS